jgi:plasmid maintenance system antidote protein VapI
MKIKHYLEKYNISGYQFAKDSGIPQGTIARLVLEKGGGVTLATATKIVAASKGKVRYHDLPHGPMDGGSDG